MHVVRSLMKHLFLHTLKVGHYSDLLGPVNLNVFRELHQCKREIIRLELYWRGTTGARLTLIFPPLNGPLNGANQGCKVTATSAGPGPALCRQWGVPESCRSLVQNLSRLGI